MNKVMLIGNVGRDPELTYTPTGSAVAKFSLAVSRRWNDKTSGEKKEETIWFTLTAWERLAETCSQTVHKGDKLYAEGRLAPIRIYTDKDGKPAAAFEVILTNIEYLTPKGTGTDAGSSRGTASSGPEEVSGGGDFPF